VKDSFPNAAGRPIIDQLVETIRDNRSYLSELDGAIGDGDHGINMAKGFNIALQRLERNATLSEALQVLARVLMLEIGGSMGPLYGSFFDGMARASRDREMIDAGVFGEMLDAAVAGVRQIGNAEVGDKTLVDTLDPAVRAYKVAAQSGRSFAEALADMSEAGCVGKESTKDLVAKVGRSARLGDRSRGFLDAGATSCWLVLDSMARSIEGLLV
jgi:dihydroxyacetone kinase-like protein